MKALASDVAAWGDAVVEFLKASNGSVRRSHIAGSLGLNRGLLSQYLKGIRTPTQDTLRQINAAVGEHLKNPAVTAHLDAEAMLQGIIDAGLPVKVARVLDGFRVVLDRDVTRFWINARKAIGGLQPYRGRSADDRRLALTRELHRAARKYLLATTAGRVPRQSGLDEACEIFRLYGINPEKLHAGPRIVWFSELSDDVHRALVESFPGSSAPERWAAHQRILAAVVTNLTSHPGPFIQRKDGES